MYMKKAANFRIRLFIVFVLGVLIFLAVAPLSAGAQSSDARDLQSVWDQVNRSGAYSFSADLTQVTKREQNGIAYGPSTQKTRVHMEGQTDIETGELNLTLWNGGGSVMVPESGAQIRIADGQAMARRGDGTWQQIDDFSGLVAPGGDFMAFVSGAKNVVRHEPEVVHAEFGQMTVTRFTFDIDGPQYAAYMRDLLAEQMRGRGELPPGMKLELPEVYAGMTGRGELWVGEDGLPVSQTYDLTFPAGSDGKESGPHTAQIAVTFSRFAGAPTATFIHSDTPVAAKINQALAQSGEMLENVSSFKNLFAILMAIIIIVGLVLVMRRSGSRPVYAAVVVSVIFSMLASPMLNSMHVSAYSQKQVERQAVQETQQAEAEAADAWQEALNNPNFNPHASPLALAKTRPESVLAAQTGGSGITAGGIISATSQSSEYFDSSCETDPGSDNDGDGLTNLEECLIGTLPGATDSDQDGVEDNLEVNGFVYDDNSSVTWYTNPIYPDTNRDGLGDGYEWNTDANSDGLPDDTDGDGLPDLWDDDNDGDGVPDDLDLSPYSTTKDSNVFDGDNPFQLIVDDLGDGLITKVEFQLTPTNPDHLWYTNNVLDWADNDRQGQIQDADGLTFYDVDNTVDPYPNDLGDVRLVPMLEIEMTGTPNNLPDQHILNQFGISTHETDTDTTTAYVPVGLVTDNTGNQNVAFHGTMYYLAASTWGNAQTVRLVWLVQALVDVCESVENGICNSYSAYNDVQIIHTYDEEWFLTGMEISEEQGTNLAIVYEDPAVTSDAPLYMDTLYPFAYGLDRTFMAGADCEVVDQNNNCVSGNGKFDLTVTGIYTRFNHTTNGGVPDVQRWGLDNVFSVVTNTYPALGLAMLDTAITQTVDVLTNTFTSAWSAANPITPTLLFAWEHNYRPVSLSSDHLSWVGNILTVDVASSGADPVQVQQTNVMKWAPFGYNPTDGWFSADFNSYWSQLDILLPPFFSGDDDIEGEVASAKFLYLGMYSGENNVVRRGDLLLPKNYEFPDLPILLQIFKIGGSGIKKGIAVYFGDVSDIRNAFRAYQGNAAAPLSTLDKIGVKIQKYVQTYLSLLEESVGVIGIALLMVTTYAALIVVGIYLVRKYVLHDNISKGLFIATAVALGTLAFIVGVIKPILSIIKTINELIAVGESATKVEAIFTMFISGEGGPSIEYNVVGLAISIGIAVGFMIALMTYGHVKPGSIAAQIVGANTIAAIIEAFIIFLLNLNPFTAILVGIAAIIDLILFLLGVNFSITGKLTEVIADALYSFDLSVDAGVDTGSIATELADPAGGMVAGNQMIFSMPITTVITQSNKVDINEDQFRSNSFVYDLDDLDAFQSGLSTNEGDRANEWVVIDSNVLGYIGTVTDTVSYAATLSAGVNRSYIFYLDSAYDLLGESCWWIAGCKDKYVDGSNSTDVGSSFVFDIYPSTIEGFVDVTAWSNGNVRIADADGDGLLPLGAGGVDPDDTTWDADGDNLSDQFELEMRAVAVEEGGEALDPLLMDTDSDGIPDDEELWLATNPAGGDSDGDGIPDVREAARADEGLVALAGGWLFPYSINNITRVWSDPNYSDYDADGMSDLFELSQDTCPDCNPWADPNNPLLFSPYVYNENPVPIFLDDTTNDGFVAPGASFVYSTTTANNLSDGILLAGDVALSLPDIFSGAPLTAEVALNSGYSETLVSEIAPAVSSSMSGILTSSANLAAFEDVIWSWDPEEQSVMTPIGGDIKQLDVAVAAGFSDLYVYTALEIDDNGMQYITAYAAGNEGNPSDALILTSLAPSIGTFTAPEVACNEVGNCLVIYASNGADGNGEIFGIILNGTLDDNSGNLLLRLAHSLSIASPVVTSDGEDFMIGWSEYAGSESSTLALQVNQDSSTSALIEVWNIDNPGESALGLAWTGSNYLAVWINGYDATMHQAEIDPSLNVGPVTTVPGLAETFPSASGVDGPLTLSYDPLSKQALVIYRDLDQDLLEAFYMSAQRLTAAGSSPEIKLDVSEEGTTSFYADIAACADPLNGGWIVVWSKNGFNPDDPFIHYQAIAPDGSLRGSEQLVSTSNENAVVALGCRAPHPLLDLEFEENTTSASYADSSQNGNDATCLLSAGHCPLGGGEGRFGFGVEFDGVDDRLNSTFTQPTDTFTIDFWMKTTCSDCILVNHLGTEAYIDLENGQVCIHANGPSGFESFCTFGTNYADGDWHHVVQIADGAGNQVYVDGEIQDNFTFTFSEIVCTSNCNNLVLGKRNNDFFTGSMDQVRFYNRALSSAEVEEAFSAAVTILDLDEPAGSTTAYDAANNGFSATCSGSSCPTFGVEGIASTAADFDGSNDHLTISPQARTLESFVYNFEDSDTSGWSNGSLETATREGTNTQFLGDFGNEEITLDLTNLPTHDTVTIAFDLYVLGSWDGNRTDSGPDIWQWGHDGTSLLNTTFSNQPDTSPNYQMYPAGYPYFFQGITLYENSNFSGTSENFTEDDPNLSDNPIGNDRASAFVIYGDTASILYKDSNYGSTSWIMDPKRGNENIPTNDTVSSLRVFSALHSPGYGATGDSLTASGFSETSVYHIEFTLDSHTADSLSLYFEGLASDEGQERWGLDNVVVDIQSVEGSIPLTNNPFTIAAWAKRDTINTGGYIFSQGISGSNDGVNLYFTSSTLNCSVLDQVISYNLPQFDTEWHHSVCVFNETEDDLKLYYDGIMVNSIPLAGDYDKFGDTTIGQRYDNTNRFNGTIDEVGVWTVSLSEDQILELFQKVRVEDQAVLHGIIPVQEDSDLTTVDIILRETDTGAGLETQVVTRTLGVDADNPSATIQDPLSDQYISGLGALEISGSAGDPTSYITSVEVQIDGGPWVAASGTESWSYTVPAGTLGDGLHTASARATDVVSFTGTSAAIQFIVDDTAPDIGFDTGGTTLPILDQERRWFVTLNGTAGDPPAGTQPGSGLVSVEVLLEGGPNVVGNGWQTATLDAGFWSINYILPQIGTGGVEVGNPSGVYTVSVRATDAVNNTTPESDYVSGPLTLVVQAPVPTLDTFLPLTRPITTSLTITGQILDNYHIEAVEIGFSPGSNIDALSEAVLHLPFDETQLAIRYFSDRSGSNNPAGCTPGACPLVGQAGQRDQALEFDGLTQHAYIADDDSIDFGTDEDFTVALWVYADPIQPGTGIDNDIVEKWSGGRSGYPYVIRYLNQTGQIRVRRYDGSNNPGIDSTALVNDGLFHHIAFVKSGDTLYLYIDGILDGTATDTTTGVTTNSSDLFLAMRGNNLNHFKGNVDELVIHDRALADYEIADLYNYGLTIWDTATFDFSQLNPIWSYTIPEGTDGLEGIFQINVRATDDLGFVTGYDDQRLWRGEIDTRPPAAVFTATVASNPTTTTYSCAATDFNLDADTTCIVLPPDTIPAFSPTNQGRTFYNQVDLWYLETISDTSRLYGLDATAVYNGNQPTDMVIQACDIYDRCTSVTSGSAAPAGALNGTAPLGALVSPRAELVGLNLDAGVLTPTNGTVLTSTLPVTVSGFAVADMGLQSLSVTANGVEVYSQNWPVTPTITNTVWSFAWSPAGEGIYLFETEVQDWLGNMAAGSLTSTVYVDLNAPTIEINPLVLTTTHQFGDSAVQLTGTAFDSLQLHRVQVGIDGSPMEDAGLDDAGNWQWPWLLDGQPDGETFNVTATASDLAGRTASVNESVLVDIMPPERVTVTLDYQNSGGQILPITAGDTLTDAVSLMVNWTAGSDGSGITAHRVGWSQNATPVLSELTSYPDAGTHTQSVGEAETWYAHVLVVDGTGNVTSQTQGPVYVDGWFTPDEIDSLSYHGWANEVCAIEGVDRRLVHLSPDFYAGKQQRFYVSWDETALRLYWEGANWNHDGDLFVYLDTRPGGSDRLYNPYPDDPDTTIYLPGNFPEPSATAGMRQQKAQASITPVANQSAMGAAMGADYLVWVEGSGQAVLYRWDGFAWTVQQELDSDRFRLDLDVAGSDTDLWLPFAEIGIADPATAALGLLAVATEEEALQLWATMPVRNPANSSRVVNPIAGLTDQHTFPLVRSYFWDSLGSGLCGNGRLGENGIGPTGGPFAESDLQLTLTAGPVGTTYNFMNDEMAWLWALLFGFDDIPIVPSDLFTHQDTTHPLLGSGQIVTFTIDYENRGTETAQDVIVELDAWFSLQLAGGNTLELGDIPAGATGSVQFNAFIDPAGVDPEEQEWAALDAFVYDEQHPENPNGGSWSSAPLEWMWSDHRVDVQPPAVVTITTPDFVIPAGLVTIRGEVVDESPVPLLNLEVLDDFGNIETIACTEDTPTDGRWSCAWDAAGAADGDTFQVRAQAVDIFGQSSAWTVWNTLEVDTTPPAFSLVDGNLIFGPGIHHLNGGFEDEREIGYVHVCQEDGDCSVHMVNPHPVLPPGTLANNGIWATYLPPPAGTQVDGQSQTLLLFGSDAAGNRTEPVSITYQMDNTPPALTVTYVANLIPALGDHLIASGIVLDGSPVDVHVLVDPPAGTRQRMKASVAGNDWSFTHAWTQTGVYTLWMQAIDAAGNATTVGPFTVLVGEANQVYLPFVFNNAALVPRASDMYLPIVFE